MNKEHNAIRLLDNEMLLDAYGGAAMALGDGSFEGIINMDLIWSDMLDLRAEILNRMKGGDE